MGHIHRRARSKARYEIKKSRSIRSIQAGRDEQALADWEAQQRTEQKHQAERDAKQWLIEQRQAKAERDTAAKLERDIRKQARRDKKN